MMGFKAFASWLKTNFSHKSSQPAKEKLVLGKTGFSRYESLNSPSETLGGGVFKKECVLKEEKHFEDVIAVASTSGYPYIDYPVFPEEKAPVYAMAYGKKYRRKFRRSTCKFCGYISRTKKGLRFHLITIHKDGVLPARTVDAYGRPLNFFGEIPELEEPKPQYVPDGDFAEEMSQAINQSIEVAAQRLRSDSDDE